MSELRSVRVFIAGKTGTGKTYRAWHTYLKHMPRVIILDSTGEWEGKAHVDTHTVSECVEAILDLAPNGTWTVRYTMADEGFDALVSWLLPVPDIYRAPSKICGGIGLLADEIDLLVPFGPPSHTARNLYRRSRHADLSVISCSLAPSNCSKECARQSDHRIALFLDEPADIDYMVEAMRWTPEQTAQYLDWCRRHPHGAVWKETQTGRLLWLR